MYAKKNSGKKVVATLLAIVLLIGCGIGGTLAWLSATSETVTNTFTVGDITIHLNEHKLADGKLTSEVVQTNTDYKVVPGATQPKDPYVTVDAGNEPCYVYVCIKNNLVIDSNIVATFDIDLNKWDNIATTEKGDVYRYKTTVPASNTDQILKVFENITYDDDLITKENISTLENKTIILNAFAHQSENITNDSVANNAALAYFATLTY